jgi:hypothetical protein
MRCACIEQLIGNTPLVGLQRLPGAQSARRGNLILAKLEGHNPGGSAKDRVAWSMIRRAEERGEDQARRSLDRGHPRQHWHRDGDNRGDRHLSTGVFGARADPAVAQPRAARPRAPCLKRQSVLVS